MSLEPNAIEAIETKEESTETAEHTTTAPNESPVKALFAKIKANKKKKEKKKKTVAQEIMSWVWTILAALVIATLVRTFIAEPVRVDGNSMANTLQDGEIVLVSKMAYGQGSKGMTRGDIVICQYPNRQSGAVHLGGGLTLSQNTIFVKRLVGLPGDTVEIKDHKLYVNGEQVADPELMGSLPADFGPIKLAVDNPRTKDCDDSEYFVIGDNRGNSHDSRDMRIDDTNRFNYVGPIRRNMIVGKVTHVLFPFNAIRGVE